MIAGQLEIQLLANMARLQKDMEEAKRLVGGAMSAIEKSVDLAKNALGALGVGLSVDAIVSFTTKVIDAADAVNDMSQRVGIAVKDLAKYELATSQSGTTMEDLARGAKSLSVKLEEHRTELAKAGITAKDTDGAMQQIADLFARMPDGIEKTNLAVKMFDKSGMGLIPMLNMGSEGLKEAAEKSAKYAAQMAILAPQADRFNDNMAELAMASKVASLTLVNEVMPALIRMSQASAMAAQEGGKLQAVWAGLGTGLRDWIGRPMEIMWLRINAGIDEANASLMRFFGQNKAAGELLNAVNERRMKILALEKETEPPKPADPPKFDTQTWMADYKKLLGAIKDGSNQVDSELKLYTSTLQRLEQEMGNTIHQTEEQKVMYQLTSGSLRTLTADHAKEVIAKAKEVDALKAGMKVAQERVELRKKEQEAIDEYFRTQTEGYNAAVKASRDALQAAKDEYEQFGMSKSQIAEITMLKLKDKQASYEAGSEGHKAIQKQIEAQEELIGVLKKIEVQQEWKSIWDNVEATAHETFISIFDSGKNAFERLRDALKNGLLDLLYQMTLKKWILSIGATVSGVPGIAGAAASGATSSAAGGIGGSIGTVLGGIGTFGAGFSYGATSLFANGLSATLSAGSSMIGAGSIVSGLGTIAGALGPIALGISAVYSLVKSLDHSGTIHTGGAASASATGTQSVDARSLGFMQINTSDDAQKMVSGIASSIVGILDSTATTFGKTAGYSAATAFADDTSEDGAWGALLVKKMGDTLIDWDSNRQSRWAPREFADGEAGRNQYLAALSTSVRTALDDIGLPGWAKQMLDQLGDAPALDQLATVVDQINQTQVALVNMGKVIAGFSDLSDEAASALIKSSGGIGNLGAMANSFYENYYSEAEKVANTTKQITEELAKAGLVMPATRDEYKAMVEQQIKLGDAGVPAVAALMKVNSAFASITETANGAVKAAGLMDAVNAANDILKRSVEAQRKTVTEAYQAAMGRLQTSLDGVNTRIGKLSNLSGALKSTLDHMTIAGMASADYAEAQAKIQTALAIARAGGPLPDSDSIARALDVVSQPNEAAYKTFLDFQREQILTKNSIQELSGMTDVQLSIEDQTLQSIKDQIKATENGYQAEMKRFDDLLSSAQAQIDALNGIDTTVKSIADAILGFNKASATAGGGLIGGATVIPSVVGDVSKHVDILYNSILGRTPDAEGMAYWSNLISNGTPIYDIVNAIRNSDEYKTKYPAFAGGGDHLGGIALVGEQGPELINTGPARIFNAGQTTSILNGRGNVELIAEIRALRATVERQQAALDKIERGTTKTKDILVNVTRDGNALLTESA